MKLRTKKCYIKILKWKMVLSRVVIIFLYCVLSCFPSVFSVVVVVVVEC